MKQLIDEINISYKLFVDADNHARLDDMCRELISIRETAYMIVDYCNKHLEDLNSHK